jgi:hypothetical protein
VLDNKNKNEIASYLAEIETNRMGLTANNKVALEVAEILLKNREAIIDEGF